MTDPLSAVAGLAGLASRSSTGEKSAAGEMNKEQKMGSTGNISLAQKVDAAFRESDEYRLFFQKGGETSQTNQEGAANLLSIGHAVYVVLYGNIKDIRAWHLIYGGPTPAIALATFGRKSVWKMQAELLGRPGRPDPGDSGDPDDPGSPGGDWSCCGTNDPAAEEYKRTIEAESTRIGVSGTIIASVAVIALTLPSLSQTHWVARASWIFSVVSSLLAVYYANNQAWKAGYLLLGNKVRAWIRGHSKGPVECVEENNDQGPDLAELVRSLVPAPSSVLTVSAPGLLLSASLYFLLIGFGVYLGFMWTRALDDLAGPDDNRDVFIIYLVSLIFCYGLCSMSDAAHDRQAIDTVGGTIQDSLTKFVTRYDMSERRREETRKETEDNLTSEQRRKERRQEMEYRLGFERMEETDGKRSLMQIDLSMEILKELKETNALMKLRNIATTQEDSY